MRPKTIGILVLLMTTMLLSGAHSGEAADLREGVEQLAAAIAKGMPESRQVRVAVTDFPDLQGVTSDLGRYIAERLTTRLAQSPQFRVIERRRLGQVLGELKFGMSDLVNPEKAKQLGRIAGVEGLVVGSISDLGNTVEIDTRLIEIDTGNMLVATTATISKDDTVRGMYERGREMVAAGQLTTTPVSVPSGGGGPQSKRVGDLTINLRRAAITKNGVHVALEVLNHSDQSLLLGVIQQNPEPALRDDKGNTFRYRSRGSAYWSDEGRGFPYTDEILTLTPKSGSDVFMEFGRTVFEKPLQVSDLGSTISVSFTYLVRARRDGPISTHVVTFIDVKASIPR